MPKLPGHFEGFVKNHRAVADAYKALGDEVANDGPLDAKSRALVKLGMALGARMEGAAHSHARRALEAGLLPDEIRHAALQATTTLGFPQMMAGLAWVEDVLSPQS